MRQTIIAPDAELVAVQYLRGRLALRTDDYVQGVKVGTQMPPAVAPGRYILIRRIGGIRASLVVDRARLDLMVWHDDHERRVKLAELARALMYGAVGRMGAGVPIYRVDEFAGPVQMPDPVNDARTVTMFSLELRLRAAV